MHLRHRHGCTAPLVAGNTIGETTIAVKPSRSGGVILPAGIFR
jgi:hypothetical protein